VKTGTYDNEPKDGNADGDVGYLTFDTTNDGHQGYQGVLFKWGSLVGVSPAQVSGSNVFSTAVPVYMPAYVSGAPTTSTWKSPYVSPYTTWGSNLSSSPSTDVPYVDGSYTATDQSRSNTFLIDAVWNTKEMYERLLGDICQYLGKTDPTNLAGYRLPTESEFGLTETGNSLGHNGWSIVSTDFVNSNAYNSLGNAEGTVDLKAAGKGYAENSAMGGVIFPCTGNREYTGGLGFVGNYGMYWSGSAAARASDADSYAQFLHFYASIVSSYTLNYRCVANAVRCVKN
jgi:hypothetical protein